MITPGLDDVAADPIAAIAAAAERGHALAGEIGHHGATIGEQLALPPGPGDASKHTGPVAAEG